MKEEDSPFFEDNSEVKVSSQKPTSALCFAASVAVIGSSFQFGYNTGVINAPEIVIEDFYNQTYIKRYGVVMTSADVKFLFALTVSIFAVGGMAGSFLSGYLADWLGRKKALLANNIFVVAGVALMSASKPAQSYEMLIAGRFVIGLNSGINTGLAPLYLTEIAPMKYRGVLGMLNQMGIVTALLLSQVLGLPSCLGSKNYWNILFTIPAMFSVYQIFGLYFCPDSPAYLYTKGREGECVKALKWLRKSSNVDVDIRELKKQQQESAEIRTTGIVEIFTTRHLLRPMIIAIVMQCSQQLSGINAVFYYSTSIFISAGINKSASTYVTVGMGFANLVMTLVSMALIERAGRRILHLTGLGGMCFCSAFLAVSLNKNLAGSWTAVVSVILVIAFVVFFQVGPGAIPWFITAELFNEAARPTAISIAGLVNWTGNFIVGIAYPPLQLLIQSYTFVIFSVLLAFFWIFTYLKVPETKGKSISEISQYFVSQ